MFIILHITKEARNHLLINSMLINFNEFDYFYFKIPRFTSKIERLQYTEVAQLFFQKQFSNLDNKLIEVHGNLIWKKGINALELSWEIFFQFDKFVKVKEGIFDENLNKDISGFTGKIIDFYNDDDITLFLISFTSDSIKNIPIEYLRSNAFQTSPFFTILEVDFLLPLPFYVENKFEEREKLEIIGQILDLNDLITVEDLDMEKSLIYWRNKIQPEKDKSNEILVESEESSNLTWKDFSFSDSKYGLWGTFLKDNVEIELPLIDIDLVKNHEKLNNIMHEYQKFMFYLFSL